MKTILTLLTVLGLALQLWSSPVYAGTNYWITQNILKANEYITQLQAGAKPDSINRPRLYRHNKYRAKRTRRELNEAMDKAEVLSRQDRRHHIQLYQYPSQDNCKRYQKPSRNPRRYIPYEC